MQGFNHGAFPPSASATFLNDSCSSVPCPSAYDGKVMVEYVWLGSSGSDLRSKSRVFDARPNSVEEMPMIVVDGSSYGLGPEDHEVFLKPRKMFRDPFRAGDHLLVLCDSFKANVNLDAGSLGGIKAVLQPAPMNNRAACEDVLNRSAENVPAFAVEQEYCVLPPEPAAYSHPAACDATPPGCWPHAHLPDPSKPFLIPDQSRSQKAYASGRRLAERHLQACLLAGIKVTETSQRSSPTAPVWSYKLGPLIGIDMADELWMSRFLMLRVAEEEGISVSFDPRAAGGEGARCCVKYSTAATRNPVTGLHAIQRQLELLQTAHLLHVLAYSKGGAEEDYCWQADFNIGVGSRDAALVVPAKTLLLHGGHYVDRRPASNSDPYLVAMMIASTTLDLPHGVLQPCSKLAPPSIPSESHSGYSSLSELPCMSYGGTCNSMSTMNSEDVLIDELDKVLDSQHSGLQDEGSDECTSALSSLYY